MAGCLCLPGPMRLLQWRPLRKMYDLLTVTDWGNTV